MRLGPLAALAVLAACGGGGGGSGRTWVRLPGLEDTIVWFTKFDQKGALLAATDGGLERWDKPAVAGTEGWSRVFAARVVMAIDSDPRSDAMWVVTDGALFKLAGDGTPTMVSDMVAAGVRIAATGLAAVDGDGRVVVVDVGFGGLHAFDPATSQWTALTIDPAVSQNVALTTIIRGPSGDLWTGRPLNLFRLARGATTAMMVETCNTHPNDCPFLLRGADGKVYGGVLNDLTGYHALWSFDEATGKVGSELAKLPERYVKSAGQAVDSDGTIYLGGNTAFDGSADQYLLRGKAGQTPAAYAKFPDIAWGFDVRAGWLVASQARSGVWELK